jgi:thiol-disulfide isomerase/thioredoxin
MQNKSLFIAAALVLFVLSGLAGYFGPPMVRDYRHQKQREAFVPPGVPVSKINAFAAHFNNLSAATEPQRLPDDAFVTIARKQTRFSDFAGKPTLVNFWASWCTPCIAELPSLEKFANHYNGRMNVIAVALEPEKKAQEIAKFLENRQIGDFAGYVDEKDTIGKKLGLRGIPTSFLIGSDGLILYRFEGDADWASKESQDFFDVFLLQKR